jgi:hypothetical protein
MTKRECPVCRGVSCHHQPELPPLKPAANLFEFREIQKFTAACRKQWPGAKITLRPDSSFVRQHENPPMDVGLTMPDERNEDGRGCQTASTHPTR